MKMQTHDLIIRLCLDLQTFPNEHFIEILERCVNHLRVADPKCVAWKDLLPPVLHILTDRRTLVVNDITMGSPKYPLPKICLQMPWPNDVLTRHAGMSSREVLPHQHVDLEQIFKVLIDQNKDGKDMVTSDLINLVVYVLLKAKQSSSLQQKTTNFLTEFIGKPFIVGHSIIKKLPEWMR
uniref:FANCI_S1 domain-containing protein n=1 Tax=Glossina pallidipes TaxID=7398 RepID=A0A1A9Z290_GLOPL